MSVAEVATYRGRDADSQLERVRQQFLRSGCWRREGAAPAGPLLHGLNCRIWPMRKLWLSILFLLSVTVHGQPAPTPSTPTQAQFTAALQSVVANEAQWRKTIEAVKIEELPVSYRVGKLLEQSKSRTTRALDQAVRWAGRTNSNHRLSSEIVFLSSIQELQSQMDHFAGLLLQYDMKTTAAQKKVSDWVDALSNLAYGPIDEVRQTSFDHTTNRADLLDQSCAPAIAH